MADPNQSRSSSPVIVIDHLGLISPSTRAESESEEIACQLFQLQRLLRSAFQLPRCQSCSAQKSDRQVITIWPLGNQGKFQGCHLHHGSIAHSTDTQRQLNSLESADDVQKSGLQATALPKKPLGCEPARAISHPN